MLAIQGVVHGKTIELNESPGLPDGQAVAVTIERIAQPSARAATEQPPRVEDWVDRLVFDSAIMVGGRIVKGTTISAEAVVAEIAAGRSDRELLTAHSQLTPEDVAALRQYAKFPEPFRLTFGAWAEDGDKLDSCLELLHNRRKLGRREIAP